MESYSNIYVEEAAENVGAMVEIALKQGISPSIFWTKFVSSFVSEQIEAGVANYLVGHSGIELFRLVMNEDIKIKEENKLITYTKEYWAGYSLAKYQQKTSLSFKKINSHYPIDNIIKLYHPLHEASFDKFYEVVTSYINGQLGKTKLKEKKSLGFSQYELSVIANINIRSIQMYEQRRNDINKAQGETLYALAKALHCKIEDILEIG